MEILQSLYKVKGGFTPLQFNRAVFSVLSADDKDIFRRYETPEITFRNILELDDDSLNELFPKVMEAEMRRGFNAGRVLPVRFSVFHTSMNEYAVIVTGLTQTLKNVDVRNIFRLLMKLPLNNAVKASGLEQMPGQMAESIRNYWRNLFQDMPAKPRLPHAVNTNQNPSGEIAIYPMRISGSIVSDILTKAKSNPAMLITILQTAWALQLQAENKCQDTVLCLLTSKRSSTEGKQQSLLPVRHNIKVEQTIQDVVGKAFQQFIVSQPYAAMGRESLQEIMVQQSEGSFDNILDFCDFQADEKRYTTVEGRADGTLVQKNILDSSGVRLGLRFHSGENQLTLSLVYDCRNYTPERIARVAQEYELVLQQMLTDWYLPYGEFRDHMGERLENTRQEQKDEKDSRAQLQDALSRLQLLQECEEGVIQQFVDEARITVYFEGDRLSDKEMEGQLAFVIKGKLARSIELGDGWYKTLDIARENTWINETVLLPDKKTNLSAEVLTERAMILTIPLTTVQNRLLKSPVLVNNIIRHSIRQMEKYQRLWIQA